MRYDPCDPTPVVIWETHRPFRSRPVATPRDWRIPRRLVRLVPAALGIVMAALLAPHVVVPRSMLPAELVGVWVSDDPRYAGRALELGSGQLTIHTGSGAAAPHRVRNVSIRAGQEGEIRYAIEYVEGGGSGIIAVRLRRASGELRLERPDDVTWRRGVLPAAD